MGHRAEPGEVRTRSRLAGAGQRTGAAIPTPIRSGTAAVVRGLENVATHRLALPLFGATVIVTSLTMTAVFALQFTAEVERLVELDRHGVPATADVVSLREDFVGSTTYTPPLSFTRITLRFVTSAGEPVTTSLSTSATGARLTELGVIEGQPVTISHSPTDPYVVRIAEVPDFRHDGAIGEALKAVLCLVTALWVGIGHWPAPRLRLRRRPGRYTTWGWQPDAQP